MHDTPIEAYDRAAHWWSEAMDRLGYARAYRDLARHMLAGTHHESVADIGTGTGDLAHAVCGVVRSERLLLVDTSAAMLAAARERLDGRVPTLQIRATALADLDTRDACDLVLAGHVIEHLPDPEAGLRQLARLVKPGGKLVLVVSRPHWCQWFIWLRWRHQWYDSAHIMRMARAAGLTTPLLYRFQTGPPSRTSHAYSFQQPRF